MKEIQRLADEIVKMLDEIIADCYDESEKDFGVPNNLTILFSKATRLTALAKQQNVIQKV